MLVTPDGSPALRRPRLATTSTHGTGCTLSAAVTAGLALGRPLERAVADALDYVHRAIAAAPGLGGGHGPLDHRVHSRLQPRRPLPPAAPARPATPVGRLDHLGVIELVGVMPAAGLVMAEKPRQRMPARPRGDHLHHGGHADRVRAQPLEPSGSRPASRSSGPAAWM